MPTLTQHAPGTFCWPELYTTDARAAKAFYSGLFGWEVKELPIDATSVYTIFTLHGQDCAALNDVMPADPAKGMPPNWMAYVSTESSDDTAAKVKAAGGKVIKEPFDVMDVGRMAVLQDPTGAVFCSWQPRGHIGVGVLDEPGALTWTELATTDPAKAGPFYKQVFGWGEEGFPMEGGASYTVFKRGEANAGGMMQMPPEMQGAPPMWTSYFLVEDCDKIADKAVDLGGKVFAPPMDVPGIGRMAWLADPQGAAFAIIKYAS